MGAFIRRFCAKLTSRASFLVIFRSSSYFISSSELLCSCWNVCGNWSRSPFPVIYEPSKHPLISYLLLTSRKSELGFIMMLSWSPQQRQNSKFGYRILVSGEGVSSNCCTCRKCVPTGTCRVTISNEPKHQHLKHLSSSPCTSQHYPLWLI